MGFQLLLSRRDSQLQTLDIQSTIKRINTNKNKLVEATTKGATPKEVERLKSVISQDEVEMEYQQTRIEHIRYYLWQEISELHKYRVKFLSTLEEGCQNFVNHYSDQLQVTQLFKIRFGHYYLLHSRNNKGFEKKYRLSVTCGTIGTLSTK